jgi:hypothetical protein
MCSYSELIKDYRPTTRVVLKKNLFGRWIIILADEAGLAWSGSRWVPVTSDGLPAGAVQVSNLNTQDEAYEYARSFNFVIVSVEN